MNHDASLATLLVPPPDPASVIAFGPDGPITARQFYDDVVCAASWLIAQPASSAALFHSDSYHFAVWLFACWHSGRTVLLPPDNRPGTITSLGLDATVRLGELDGTLYEANPPKGSASFSLPPVDRQRVAIRVYTSGSTGAPTRIDKTIAQLEAEVNAVDQVLSSIVPPGANSAGTVSHQHIYGLMFRLLWPVATKRSFVTQAVRFPEELLRLPDKEQAVLVTSPVFLSALSRVDHPDGSALCLILSAGSPLPKDVARQVQLSLHTPIYEIYGSSESGAVAVRREIDATWEPLPGNLIRIGESGTLELAGPQMARPGWNPTADRARETEHGFELLGRSDRIAKIADKRVSLDSIETVLSGSPLVSETKVVVLSGQRTELGAVIVVSETGRAVLQRSGAFRVGRLLRSNLAEYFEASVLPRRFRFPSELPRDALGKVSQSRLRALFDKAQPRPPVTGRDASTNRLVLQLDITEDLDCFAGHFPGHPIVPGVAQIDWAIAFGREAFELPAHFTGIDALKFHRIIQPGTKLTLTLERRGDSVLLFEFASEAVYSSGRILFTETSS